MENNKFTCTEAFIKIKEFITKISVSIMNDPQTENQKIILILKEIENKAKEISLSKSPQRYGNKSFRILYEYISNLSDSRQNNIYNYLKNSFGNYERIDYGTGHELNFLCFLYCKYMMNCIEINEIFKTLCYYFKIVRYIISKFNLEPAGSHGPWGLDDYQILPFLFGSAELINVDITFDKLLDNSIYEYGRTLQFVKKHKCRFGDKSFEVHSPFLWMLKDKTWDHVNAGLHKLFIKEVLEKNVVTQHFIFSEYLNDREIC